MPQFSVNTHRFDPYKNFKFRVKWDNTYVAGVSAISGLKRQTEVVEHREGGDPNISRRSPGLTSYGPIVLERGVTHDTAFEAWATKVHNLGGGGGGAGGAGAEVSLKDFRKDIVIELHNEAGQIVLAYKVYRCWPSEYVALAELEANATCIAIERMVLQNEGWERDLSVVEPQELSVKTASSQAAKQSRKGT